MTLFLLIVAGIAFWYYTKKKAEKEAKEAARKKKNEFRKEAKTRLQKDYNFTEFNGYSDHKKIYADLYLDKNSNQFAYVDPEDETCKVYHAKDIVKIEIKEQHASEVKENHSLLSDAALNSSSYVKEMSVLIILKNGQSINLCLFRDLFTRMGLTGDQDNYPGDYARAVGLKETLEEMAGVSRSAAAPSQSSSSSMTDELQRLMKLKEQGVLSDEEFTQAKAKLLA
ncbi:MULTISPECIES: SHOCT domain-containing protein [Bacillus cereus group]|uniref:SHOCT domain-containing protein n=1 Tax=Bacillus cereus group TaxID=86661 RepID=UPI001F282920|nr:SHOCT domain-containing protein [Bacillus cereus]MDA1521547.1 SHOCT domain-containing protein [Bacillus cereus]BCC09360.1 hypothetical protein BCM0060_p2026 [Bacillus cereus]BCC16578.1 hypothetical protein BCM0075_1348 [Bacillus cereus]BCC50538.1 hypothetical protein BCJMU02_p2132 [Bacillus cereus]BCD08774.1 hypothetical protein BC30052_p2056 [Bacillus cereus]